jgi:hypothetical protein
MSQPLRFQRWGLGVLGLTTLRLGGKVEFLDRRHPNTAGNAKWVAALNPLLEPPGLSAIRH